MSFEVTYAGEDPQRACSGHFIDISDFSVEKPFNYIALFFITFYETDSKRHPHCSLQYHHQNVYGTFYRKA